MDYKIENRYYERQKNKKIRQGYPFLIAWAWATQKTIQRFFVYPCISKLKKIYWEAFAKQIKTIIDDRDAHLDHHQASHPDE